MMDIRGTRWRDIIYIWLFRLGYELVVDEIISLIAEQVEEWGGDLASTEDQICRTGSMTREQKRMNWDALRFVLYLHLTDPPRERNRRTVPLGFDPAAAEMESDPAVQRSCESLEDMFFNALSKLPRRLQEVILKKYKGATFRQIGDECGMSVGHAHALYNMAIRRLKRVLNEARSEKPRA